MDRDSSSDTHIAILKTQIQALMDDITVQSTRQDPMETPAQLDTLEQQIHALTRQLADHVTALSLQQSIDSKALQDKAKQLILVAPEKATQRRKT